MCMMITDRKLQTFAPAIIHSEDIPRQATNHRQRVRIFPCPALCPADGQKWKGNDENDERLVLPWQVPANSRNLWSTGSKLSAPGSAPWPAAISSDSIAILDPLTGVAGAIRPPLYLQQIWCRTQTLAQYETPNTRSPTVQDPRASRASRGTPCPSLAGPTHWPPNDDF